MFAGSRPRGPILFFALQGQYVRGFMSGGIKS